MKKTLLFCLIAVVFASPLGAFANATGDNLLTYHLPITNPNTSMAYVAKTAVLVGPMVVTDVTFVAPQATNLKNCTTQPLVQLVYDTLSSNGVVISQTVVSPGTPFALPNHFENLGLLEFSSLSGGIPGGTQVHVDVVGGVGCDVLPFPVTMTIKYTNTTPLGPFFLTGYNEMDDAADGCCARHLPVAIVGAPSTATGYTPQWQSQVYATTAAGKLANCSPSPQQEFQENFASGSPNFFDAALPNGVQSSLLSVNDATSNWTTVQQNIFFAGNAEGCTAKFWPAQFTMQYQFSVANATGPYHASLFIDATPFLNGTSDVHDGGVVLVIPKTNNSYDISNVGYVIHGGLTCPSGSNPQLQFFHGTSVLTRVVTLNAQSGTSGFVGTIGTFLDSPVIVSFLWSPGCTLTTSKVGIEAILTLTRN